MIFLRHKQRSVTAVSPHVQNPRYLIPKRGKGGRTPVYPPVADSITMELSDGVDSIQYTFSDGVDDVVMNFQPLVPPE